MCREVLSTDRKLALDGADSPESVFFDASTNAFYVPNAGNFAGFTAGDGFISKTNCAVLLIRP